MVVVGALDEEVAALEPLERNAAGTTASNSGCVASVAQVPIKGVARLEGGISLGHVRQDARGRAGFRSARKEHCPALGIRADTIGRWQ